MLDDDIVTMEVDAAETLVLRGGNSGLAAVLDVLGRRRDDPDADYMGYRLYELDASGERPIIDLAESMREHLSENALTGLEDLLVLRFPERRGLARKWSEKIGLDEEFEAAVDAIDQYASGEEDSDPWRS